jgi:hypothetical protein
MTLFDTGASHGRKEFNAISEAERPRTALNWREARSKKLD